MGNGGSSSSSSTPSPWQYDSMSWDSQRIVSRWGYPTRQNSNDYKFPGNRYTCERHLYPFVCANGNPIWLRTKWNGNLQRCVYDYSVDELKQEVFRGFKHI